MAMTVEALGDLQPQDALVIVAFPSTGAASPIAGQYLIERLEMPLVGHITSEAFAGVVHVQDGVATSPIRIYGGDVACQLDKPCQRVYIVCTEIPAPLAVFIEAAECILAWAKNSRLVLALEAMVRGEGDDSPDVFHVASSAEALTRLGEMQLPALPRATIAGGTAALLSHKASEVPVVAFVVEASLEHPDGRAAVALVEAIDPLLPQIKIDAKPLLEDAMRLEEEIRKAVDEAERAHRPRRSMESFI